MIRKLSLNPIDKHNLKENSNIPISPYSKYIYIYILYYFDYFILFYLKILI